LIPVGIWLFCKLVPPEIFARNLQLAQAASSRPISKIAATAIILLWTLLAVWLAFIFDLHRRF
jgi:hypothetical protein